MTPAHPALERTVARAERSSGALLALSALVCYAMVYLDRGRHGEEPCQPVLAFSSRGKRSTASGRAAGGGSSASPSRPSAGYCGSAMDWRFVSIATGSPTNAEPAECRPHLFVALVERAD